MEFRFSINNILGDEVSLVDNNLRPFRNNHSSQTYRAQLCTIIDDMGAASAKAQNLGAAITTGSRLSHSDHQLYIMKDDQGSRGEGSVVGILKIGHKKLFVYDAHGRQHEMDPLCVLDFYVHESKQRAGLGKRLFEYMLRDKQIKAVHLAVDRPSAKFIQFLGRHYQMKVPINQVNNFAVFEGFFNNRPAETSNSRRRGKPPIIPNRQNRNRGYSYSIGSAGSDSTRCLPHVRTELVTEPNQSVELGIGSCTSPLVNPVFTAHCEQILTGADRWQHPLETRGDVASAVSIQHREAAGGSSDEPAWSRRHGSLNLLHHESVDDTSGKEMLRNIAPRETNSATNERVGSAGKNNSESPSHRAMGAHNSMYSRHQDNVPPQNPAAENARRNRGYNYGIGTTPPMLRRDGPSAEYLEIRNNIGSASTYQNRRGHLLVSNTSPSKENPGAQGDIRKDQLPTQKDTSWNMLGVQGSPKHSAGSGRHQQTRLW